MQRVTRSKKCNSIRESETNNSFVDHSSSRIENINVESSSISIESLSKIKDLYIVSDFSESDEDGASEVESIIDQEEYDDDDTGPPPRKFLLKEAISSCGIDVETQCRFELNSSAIFSNSDFVINPDESPHENFFPISDAMYKNQIVKEEPEAIDGSLDDDDDAADSNEEEDDEFTLGDACRQNDLELVKRYISQELRNANEINEDGESMLSIACENGYVELAEFLLTVGAHVDSGGLRDMTPLMEACNAGHTGVVELLLKNGADVNAQSSQERKPRNSKFKQYREPNQPLPQLTLQQQIRQRQLQEQQQKQLQEQQQKQLQEQQHQEQQEQDRDNDSSVLSIVCPEGNTPLMFACAAGHEEIVRMLLDAGANIEDHNENGHTPLMEAASAGHVGIAKLLIERGAGINTHSNEFKESALTLACYKGHLEMVRFLLAAGADREHKTDEMHTALMEASMDGHVEVARLLLDSGAQVNMPADSFESPLTLAACGGHVELAMLLLERGANIEEVNDEGYTPLMEAAREGHEEMVALLLSQGADINAQTEETQETALTLACCGGFVEVCDFLLKAGADIELGSSSPLMEAAQEGHVELVRYLISNGANVNATTASCDTALTYACENGHTDVADLLLQAFAKLEHESEGGRTPLMKAAGAGHLCTVQFLISKGADINRQTANNDHTPLSLSCAGGHALIVETLLNYGADSQHKLKDNSTMIMEASKGGHAAVVQMLLDYPNSMLSQPPPPPDLTELANAPTPEPEEIQAPRVPAHGQQVYQEQPAETNVPTNTCPSTSQSPEQPVRATLIAKKGYARKLSASKIKETPPSGDHNYCFTRPGHTTTSPQAPPPATTTTTVEAMTYLQRMAMGGGGGSLSAILTQLTEHLSVRERLVLERLLNSAMTMMTAHQVQQKQYVLEELQRAEREMQEKAQAQLLLTAQQHPPLHGFGSLVSGGAAAAVQNQAYLSISSSPIQHVLINNNGAVMDIETISSLAAEMSATNLASNLRAAAAAGNMVPLTQALQAQQLLYQTQQKALQELQNSVPPPLAGGVPVVSQHCHARWKKRTKSGSDKPEEDDTPAPPQPFRVQPDEEEAALPPETYVRNVTLTEQQKKQLLEQQLHYSQQFVLSEISQNLSMHGREYCEGAIAGIMSAMGGIKLNADGSSQTTIPIYDPIAVGQTLLQQQNFVQQQPRPPPPPPPGTPTDQGSSSVPMKFVARTKSKGCPLQNHVIRQHISCGECTHDQIQAAASATGYVSVGSGGASNNYVPQFTVAPIVPPNTSAAISQACGSTSTHTTVTAAVDEGLMVAAPARTLHETLGDIMSGPTTQLAGTHHTKMHQNHCPETNCPDHLLQNRVRPPKSVIEAYKNPLPAHVQMQPCSNPDCINRTNQHQATQSAAVASQTQPGFPSMDLNSYTDSNHDTALTLACSGTSSHEELVTLLLARGADLEHRDKKGFAPLMLAATAGHAGVVNILLDNGADLEAQAERTKDTALSLACSGGRYEVVETLIQRGANKEHRNVSDYTPLSLAASGGYVNIIRLLLNNGAEINSRTGSKLGISPLMLAAMNGHAQAVRLLLDMGSDINAQIETNRNTALTLACFQGRNEVVSLLLDRKANVEHRAKTGLTPLMEAASGGYVEVGKVLIDKGADVNASPVPSSRDTALTIAADKGHYRFVQLLLERDAIVEVKNKKGHSPLHLAANGGHMEVVQLLYAHNADIDSQDNRKVSCLMSAFRKGHIKVVKWMVKHVAQFPSDQEMSRYMSTITDKELLKKCSQCVDTIRIAKERQAAEANKHANTLLEEIDMERCREENRKAAAARRREKKRKKKKEKQEQIRAAAKVAEEEETKKSEKGSDIALRDFDGNQADQSDMEEDEEEDDEEEEANEPAARLSPELPPTPIKSKPIPTPPQEIKPKENHVPETNAANPTTTTIPKPSAEPVRKREANKEKVSKPPVEKKTLQVAKQVPKPQETDKNANEKPKVPEPHSVINNPNLSNNVVTRGSKRKSHKQDSGVSSSSSTCTTEEMNVSTDSSVAASPNFVPPPVAETRTHAPPSHKQKEIMVNGLMNDNNYSDFCSMLGQHPTSKLKSKEKFGLDTFGELDLDISTEMALSVGLRSPSGSNLPHGLKSSLNSASPKKWQKRDEGWKEVVRSKLFNRSKKVSVPANAISRVIGRGGMNINAIRESSGAHIEVEKQKGQGDRTVIIRGSPESTRLAQQLISALIKEPEKDLSEILAKCGVISQNSNYTETFRPSSYSTGSPSLPTIAQVSTFTFQNKNYRASMKPASIPPPSLPATATPPFSNQIRSSSHNIRPGIPAYTSTTPPFNNNNNSNNGISAWTSIAPAGKISANIPRPPLSACSSVSPMAVTTVTTRVVVTTTNEKSPISRQLVFSDQKSSSSILGASMPKGTMAYTMSMITQANKSPKSVSTSSISVATKVTTVSDTRVSTVSPATLERAGSAPPCSVASVTVPCQSSAAPLLMQPYSSTNHSPKSVSDSTSQPIGGPIPVRIPTHQAKPFNTAMVTTMQTVVTIATTTTPAAESHTNMVPTVPPQYSPFDNIFSNVAQSMFCQKEAKPNFASVAASGVTSVASQIQNSSPVQASISLGIPPSPEHDLVVDAAKAPGYRGNLYISSGGLLGNPPQIGIPQNQNFGPIGSGPRSAPCTPPMAPIGPPSQRHSTPSPPPSLQRADTPPRPLPQENIFQNMRYAQMGSPGGTTSTTFSQHSPLSSILPETGGQVVQSNLNPNAPDFSSRSSLLMTSNPQLHHHLHHHQQQQQQQQLRPPVAPAGSNFPDVQQFRSTTGVPLTTLLATAQAAVIPQSRIPYPHQNQSASNDFNPSLMNSLVQDNSDSNLPLLSMVPGYHQANMSSGINNSPLPFGVIGARQNQRSANSMPSMGNSSKDEGSPISVASPAGASPQSSNMPSPTPQEAPNPAGTIGADRKLPRPIGMERAQRKNIFGGVLDSPMWPYSSMSGRSDLPNEWLHNMQSSGLTQMQNEETSLPPSLHNFNANRFAEIINMESNHSVDQSFQAAGGFPYVNGLSQQLLAQHLYQNANNSSTPDTNQMEMWGLHVKMGSGNNEAPLQNNESKVNWQNWSPHQS